tara:strand:+ start:493 stop:852 length:360 start_codon:yes stop_codon:yes gene_type:complete
MKMIIYHNPSCSKSCKALSILQKKGLEVEVIEYLRNPLSVMHLRELANKLNLRPRDFLRAREVDFKALNIDLEDDDAVLNTLEVNPQLLQRPIVTNGENAVIGRPPENVLKLLDEDNLC